MQQDVYLFSGTVAQNIAYGKPGAAPELLWPLLDTAAAQEHIRVKGLMAIPPVNDDDAQNLSLIHISPARP